MLVFVILLGAIGIVLGLILNIMVIVVFMRKASNVNNRDIVFISLAISDIIRAGIGYPLLIHAEFNKNTSDNVKSCDVVGFIITFTSLVSLIHHLGIAIERAFILSNPYRRLDEMKVSLFIIIPSWLYGLLWSLAPLLGWSSYKGFDGSNGYMCSINLIDRDTTTLSYAYALLICCYFASVIGILVCWVISIRASKALWSALDDASALQFHRIEYSRQQTTSPHASDSAQDSPRVETKSKSSGGTVTLPVSQSLPATKKEEARRKQAERNITITSFVMMAVFVLSWTIYAACVIILATGGQLSTLLHQVGSLLAKLSTVFNPIIYIIWYKDFRLRFKQCFKQWCDCTLALDSILDIYDRYNSSTRTPPDSRVDVEEK